LLLVVDELGVYFLVDFVPDLLLLFFFVFVPLSLVLLDLIVDLPGQLFLPQLEVAVDLLLPQLVLLLEEVPLLLEPLLGLCSDNGVLCFAVQAESVRVGLLFDGLLLLCLLGLQLLELLLYVLIQGVLGLHGSRLEVHVDLLSVGAILHRPRLRERSGQALDGQVSELLVFLKVHAQELGVLVDFFVSRDVGAFLPLIALVVELVFFILFIVHIHAGSRVGGEASSDP